MLNFMGVFMYFYDLTRRFRTKGNSDFHFTQPKLSQER